MSKNTLRYKGYLANIAFSAEDMCLHGKIEGISDLVTFEAVNAEDIEKEFHSAVDDYLTLCKEIGKEPNKYYSGTFNIRIDPAMHKSLDFYATEHNMTLNSVVSEACGFFVKNDLPLDGCKWLQAKESIELKPQKWEKTDYSVFQSAA